MGRPKIDIDEDLVYDLAVKGWTNKEIAAKCNCSHDTLERRFAATIKEGHAVRNGSIRAKQVEMALNGNATMLVWLGKNLLGQRDKMEQSGEVTVRDASDRLKQIMNERINGSSNGHAPTQSNGANGVS